MKRVILAAVLSGLFCVSCSSDGSSLDDQRSELRIFNAAPQYTLVDTAFDQEIVQRGLPFAQASDWFSVETGRHRIQINAPGVLEPVADERIRFDAAGSSTVFVAGSGSLDLVKIDSYEPLPVEERAHFRFIVMSPSAPSVDAYLVDPLGDIDINSEKPEAQGVDFKKASDFDSIGAGRYRVVFTLAGTKTILTRTEPIDFPSQSLQSFVLLDSPGGGFPLAVATLEERPLAVFEE